MASETRKSATPPYIAFPTFLSFIKGLGEAGVPSRIDKSLLRNMSGSNQSALLSALKWFALIDDSGRHGDRLDLLVKAGDKAGEVLRGMLPDAYLFMSDGTIDVARATGAQLEEKFREYGISGETVAKAMSFFLAACKEAGMTVSSHIKLPKITRANGAAKAKKGRQSPNDDGDVQEQLVKPAAAPRSATDTLMDKFPAFDPTWPPQIQEQWFAAFAKMQDMVKSK